MKPKVYIEIVHNEFIRFSETNASILMRST